MTAFSGRLEDLKAENIPLGGFSYLNLKFMQLATNVKILMASFSRSHCYVFFNSKDFSPAL